MLVTVGIPREVILPGMEDGVTEFTSAIVDGHLSLLQPTLAEPDLVPYVARDLVAIGGVYHLGSRVDRRLDNTSGFAYGLARGTGEVLGVHFYPGAFTREQQRTIGFVNSGLWEYMACLHFFYTAYPLWLALEGGDGPPPFPKRRRFVYSHLRRGLIHRDPRAFADPWNFWPHFLYEAFDQFLA